MLGIVFSEFTDMVETKFSADMLDSVLDDTDFDTAGAYTSVGLYDHQELVAMVSALSQRTKTPIPELINEFGRHLMNRFVERYPDFFKNIGDLFDFLETVDTHIHVEVLKLYPHAELPKFDTDRIDENTMAMTYRSSRNFGDLAKGLIEGAAIHFKQPIKITVTSFEEGGETCIKFLLTRA